MLIAINNILKLTLRFISKNDLYFISVLMLLNIFFEIIGIALLIPIVKIIFLNEIEFTFLDKIISKYPELFGGFYLPGNEKYIFILLIIIFITYFVKYTFNIFYYYYLSDFSFKLEKSLSNNLFKSYINRDYSFFLNLSLSDATRNIFNNNANVIISLISLLSLVVETLIFLSLLAISISLFTIPSIFAFGSVIIVGILYFFIIKKKIKKWGVVRNYYNSIKIKNITEMLKSIKEVFIYSKTDFFYKQFKLSNHNSLYPNRNIFFTKSSFKPILEFTLISMILFLAAFVYLNEYYSEKFSGDLVLFILILLRLIPSINRIMFNFQQINYNRKSVDVIFDEFNNNKTYKKTFNQKSSLEFKNSIILENIKFKYEKSSKYIFNNLNFKIEKNSKIGIFGKSGSGKTTLLDILIGFAKPSGKILVDGNEIYENINLWQNKICYIPQKVYLLDDTIKKNICFGLEEKEINHQKLENAIKIAELNDFVYKLEKKSDTLVGDDGIRISGGQRQRIGIARAFYRDPEILILDEITSALDTKTAEKLIENILRFSEKITVIFASHDKNLLKKLDRSYELIDGEIKNENK